MTIKAIVIPVYEAHIWAVRGPEKAIVIGVMHNGQQYNIVLTPAVAGDLNRVIADGLIALNMPEESHQFVAHTKKN